MRRPTILMTLAFFLLAQVSVQAQTTFSKRYDYGPFLGGDRSPDGHLVFTDGSYAFRMDAQGEELWHAFVSNAGSGYTFAFSDIACIADGAIMVGAATLIVPDTMGLGESGQWVAAVVSSAGVGQWVNINGASFSDELYFAESLLDGTAVYGGMWFALPGTFATIKRSAFEPATLPVGDCDCDEGSTFTFMYGAHATADSGYVAWGGGGGGFCFRVNAAMQVMWCYQFDNVYVNAVAAGPGGVSYILGSDRLIKVAADGSLLWAKHIEEPGGGLIAVKPTGDILIAGGQWLTQCDSSGTVDWARQYDGYINGLELTANGEGCYLYGSMLTQQQAWVALTDNMGLIEGCSVTDVNAVIMDTTLTDLVTEDVCWCYTNTAGFGGGPVPTIVLDPVIPEIVDCFSVQVENIQPSTFSVIPVPVLDLARVSFALPPTKGSRLELLNTCGQLLGDIPVGLVNSVDIERADLPSGVYLLRLLQPGAPATWTRVLFL